MDYGPPSSSVHRIFQARTLEWVAISFSRGSSQSREQTWVSCSSCVGRQICYHWATGEAHGTHELIFPFFVVLESVWGSRPRTSELASTFRSNIIVETLLLTVTYELLLTKFLNIFSLKVSSSGFCFHKYRKRKSVSREAKSTQPHFLAYYVNLLPEIKCWKAAILASVFQILSQFLHTIWWWNYLFITSEMFSEKGKLGELGEEERGRGE